MNKTALAIHEDWEKKAEHPISVPSVNTSSWLAHRLHEPVMPAPGLGSDLAPQHHPANRAPHAYEHAYTVHVPAILVLS